MRQVVTKRLPVKNRASRHFEQQCSVIATLRLFASKWKPCIICYLSAGPMRYNELYRAIPNISRKMLSDQLRELEEDGLITRVQYDRKLQQVTYQLSGKGASLMPLMMQLQNWGLAHISNVLSISDMIAATKTPVADLQAV